MLSSGITFFYKEELWKKTIAAISTAMSASGIGIVRISGDEAMDVISRIYRSKKRKEKISGKYRATRSITVSSMMEKMWLMKFWL